MATKEELLKGQPKGDAAKAELLRIAAENLRRRPRLRKRFGTKVPRDGAEK